MWWCTYSPRKPGPITISNGYGAKGNRSKFRRRLRLPQENRGRPKKPPPNPLLPSEDFPVLHREGEGPARECAGGRLREAHQPLLRDDDGGDPARARGSLGEASGGEEDSARSGRENARLAAVFAGDRRCRDARARSGVPDRRARRTTGWMANARGPASLAFGND